MTDSHRNDRVPNEDYTPFTEFTIEPNHPSEANFGELKLNLIKGNMSHAHVISREDLITLAVTIVNSIEPVSPAVFDPLMAPLDNALEAAGKAHLGEDDWEQAPALVRFHIKEHLMAPVSAAVRVAVAQTEAAFMTTVEVERAANAG